MKIFLATSFSHQVDPDTGVVLPDFRLQIERILAALRENTELEIFCAIEHEGWKIADEPPELGVQHDLAEIDSADTVIALVHDQPSVGVEFEIGYAVGKDKQVILVRQGSEPLAYFNQGVVSSGRAVFVTYETVDELVAQLEVALGAPGD